MVYAIIGFGLLTCLDSAIKYATGTFPVMQVAFLRFFIGMLVAGIALVFFRPGWPSREMVLANGSRSLLGAITGVTFFYALSVLPLGETIALSFVAPIYIALLGALILGEKLDRRIGLALAAGFLGMLIIVGGRIGSASYSEHALWGVGAVLLAGLTYALSTVLLRQRAQTDPVLTIIFFQALGPALVLAVPAWFAWQPVPAASWPLFMLLGLLGFSGHYFLTNAFAREEAGRLAPLEYTALIWAAALGFFIFHEVPQLTTLAGALLIVAGAVLTGRKQKGPGTPALDD